MTVDENLHWASSWKRPDDEYARRKALLDKEMTL